MKLVASEEKLNLSKQSIQAVLGDHPVLVITAQASYPSPLHNVLAESLSKYLQVATLQGCALYIEAVLILSVASRSPECFVTIFCTCITPAKCGTESSPLIDPDGSDSLSWLVSSTRNPH